jgi:HPt (histidine-containing phosphotransfer) domain-containing protein
MTEWATKEPCLDTKEKRDVSSSENLDEDVLSHLAALADEDDPHFLNHLIDRFNAVNTVKMQQLREAIESGDKKQLVYWAHYVRGSSLNMGAKKMSDAAGQLEDRSEESPEVLQSLLSALEAAYRDAAAELELKWRNQSAFKST